MVGVCDDVMMVWWVYGMYSVSDSGGRGGDRVGSGYVVVCCRDV